MNLNWIVIVGLLVTSSAQAELCPAIETSLPVVRPALQSLYAKVPAKVRQALCRAPFGLSELTSSAYTTTMGGTNLNRAWAPEMTKASADQWLSWKEQLNFGQTKSAAFLVDQKLPIYKMTAAQSISGLEFLILHETGHRLHSEWNQNAWM